MTARDLYRKAWHEIRFVAWHKDSEFYQEMKKDLDLDWLDSGHWPIYRAALSAAVDKHTAPLYHWIKPSRFWDFQYWRCRRCRCVFGCQARQGVKDA